MGEGQVKVRHELDPHLEYVLGIFPASQHPLFHRLEVVLSLKVLRELSGSGKETFLPGIGCQPPVTFQTLNFQLHYVVEGPWWGGVEMRANAERLSPVEALVSPSDNRSRAERLADGVAEFSPAGRGVPCGVMLGEVIRSRGGRGPLTWWEGRWCVRHLRLDRVRVSSILPIS